MSDFIDLITPKKINHKKIRLGPKEDGGYVVSECVLNNIGSLFTYGSGDFISRPENIGFEKDFIKAYKKPVYLFDHTVGIETHKNNLINFFNEGLGFGEKCDSFFNHYKKLNIKDNVLLKIDIEGAEYDFFENTDILEISKVVSGMCIEFHSLNIKEFRERFINVCANIENLFVLNHIHGNNWGGVFNYNEYNVPIVLELSFVNKKISGEYSVCQDDYPVKDLDYPNKAGEGDIDLYFTKKKFLVNHYSPSCHKQTLCEIINAGTSEENTKSIKLNKKYKNATFYPRKFEKWPDKFNVKIQGDSLFIKRTDVEKGGWGENLLIDVEFELENDTKKTLKKQKIPRVIYQTFESYDLPKGMYKAVKSWIDLNPNYEHYFFNEQDRSNFIEKYFDKKVLNAYLSLIPGAFKADLWRCCILYEKGGVYADSDMICLRPLDDLIEENDEFIIPRDDPMSKNFLSNGFIACLPKHSFLNEQIERIVENVENLRQCYYLDISGPSLLGKSVNKVLQRKEDEEYNLGLFNTDKYSLKIMRHDYTSKTFKFNEENFIFTEYPGKGLEMETIKNNSFYSLYQKNIVYQQIPRNVYFTTYDSIYINDYMIKSFKEKNKFWNLNYYSDKDCLNFFKKENNKIKELLGIDALSFFNSLENGGERSDFWRYCVIFLYGGVYTDADTYCNVSLEKWIKHHDLILGIEGLLPKNVAESFGMDKIGKIHEDKVISVCNWTFAAKPKHEFLKNLILDIFNNPIKNNILLNTGPGRVTKHAMEYFNNEIINLEKEDVIKGSSILFKINRFGSNQSHSNSYINYQDPFNSIDDAYVVHLFDGSWRSTRNMDIKKYKSKLGVSHNLTLKKEKNDTYLGVARLDKDTARTQFLKKIGDCRSLLLFNFDKNLEIISETEKFISGFEEAAKFEDYRIFSFKNKDFYSVSYIDQSFNTRVSILDEEFKFLGNVNLKDRKFNTAWDRIWEKNWLFFEHNGELYFIYSTTPRYIVYKCIDFSNLIFETFIDIDWPLTGPTDNLYFGNIVTTGGSTNPVFVEEKDFYLYLIHTKNYEKRKYNHYLVVLNKDLMPIKFCKRPLVNEYTEDSLFFISSMIVEENYITISGGVNDNENFTWQLSKDFVFRKIIDA